MKLQMRLNQGPNDDVDGHEKANCKLNLGSGMLVFFFPFFENLASYVYDSLRARTVLFLKGISAGIFSLRSCMACARVLSLCMRLPARAGSPATAPAPGHSEAAPQSGQMSCGR